MSDYISRQAAIDAVRHAWAKGLEPSQYIEDLPPAQPEERTEERTETHACDYACDCISRQDAIRWVKTECNPYGKPTLDFESGKWVIEHLKQMPSVQQDIIYCKDCKHRPKATRADEKIFYGFSVEFPDEKCPCHCEDGWYGWYPGDDFYCGYAERRADETD